MIEARLKSEFKETRPAVNPEDPPVPTEEYLRREAAFAAFNLLVAEEPELVAYVMRHKARGVTLPPEHQTIVDAGDKVLDESNDGTQIGFDEKNGDKLWGAIFENQEHREIASAYHQARNNRGERSEAARLLSRKRGAIALSIYAEQQVKKKPVVAPTLSRAEAA